MDSLLGVGIFVVGLVVGVLLTLTLRRREVPENPLAVPLEKLDQRLRELDEARAKSTGALDAGLRNLNDAQRQLTQETARLAQALKAPQARGRWGEIQLRRVVEIAGMVKYCDFTEQTVGGGGRPDMVIRLPNDRTIIVDAKTPLSAYLEAMSAEESLARLDLLKQHAAQVRAHVNRLSERGYWRQFSQTPEFVVCFLPGESFFSAALEQDPSLIEHGAAQRVILATPTTLIALLKAVAHGWNQQRLAESAAEISELGRTLYERLATMAEHFQKVGSALNTGVRAYNETLASLETRVLATARKFEDYGAAGVRPIPEIPPVERQTRDARQSGLDFPGPPTDGV